MPKVGNKHFPYTKKGKKDAKKAAKKPAKMAKKMMIHPESMSSMAMKMK
jgi:hypothetical protein